MGNKFEEDRLPTTKNEYKNELKMSYTCFT